MSDDAGFAGPSASKNQDRTIDRPDSLSLLRIESMRHEERQSKEPAGWIKDNPIPIRSARAIQRGDRREMEGGNW